MYIQLGSNLGDRQAYLSKATTLLISKGLKVVSAGSIFETAPWGGIAQPAYLNQMLKVETKESPHDLLEICLQVERVLGRTRERKWDSRSIDIDIIYFNDWIVASSTLDIPHPYRTERNFILRMMVDIDPDFIDPIERCTMKKLAENCEDILDVKLIS